MQKRTVHLTGAADSGNSIELFSWLSVCVGGGSSQLSQLTTSYAANFYCKIVVCIVPPVQLAFEFAVRTKKSEKCHDLNAFENSPMYCERHIELEQTH